MAGWEEHAGPNRPWWVPLGQLEWTGTATWPEMGVLSWVSAPQECGFAVTPPGKLPNPAEAMLRAQDLEMMLQDRDEDQCGTGTTCSDRAGSSHCPLGKLSSGRQVFPVLYGEVHPAAAMSHGPQESMAQTPPGTAFSFQHLHISLSW